MILIILVKNHAETVINNPKKPLTFLKLIKIKNWHMAGDLYIKCFKCFHKFKMALENMTHFFIYAGYSWHVLGCDLETPISQKGLDRFALNSRKLRTTCHMR